MPRASFFFRMPRFFLQPTDARPLMNPDANILTSGACPPQYLVDPGERPVAVFTLDKQLKSPIFHIRKHIETQPCGFRHAIC